MDFFSKRGRLPNTGEDPNLEQRIKEKARSYRRAWSIIERVTPEMNWQSVVDDRADDLLVDIALLKLNRRPNFKNFRWKRNMIFGHSLDHTNRLSLKQMICYSQQETLIL